MSEYFPKPRSWCVCVCVEGGGGGEAPKGGRVKCER